MRNAPSHRELADSAIRSVNLWIDKGLPPKYAAIVAATLCGCDIEKLETLWIDSKVKEAEDADYSLS
jgi:hypothetical protein